MKKNLIILNGGNKQYKKNGLGKRERREQGKEIHFLKLVKGLPGGNSVKNPPANAGHMGLIPDPTASPFLWRLSQYPSNYLAYVPRPGFSTRKALQ